MIWFAALLPKKRAADGAGDAPAGSADQKRISVKNQSAEDADAGDAVSDQSPFSV